MQLEKRLFKEKSQSAQKIRVILNLNFNLNYYKKKIWRTFEIHATKCDRF